MDGVEVFLPGPPRLVGLRISFPLWEVVGGGVCEEEG